MKTFTQLYLANWREFSRDRMAMFFTVAFPIIFMLLFGVIFGGSNRIEAKVGIALEDQGQVGQQLAETLESLPTTPAGQSKEDNPFSELSFERGSQADLEAKLKQGDLSAVVIVPAGTSEAVAQRQPTNIQLLVDQSSQTTAPFLQGVVGSIVDQLDRGIANAPPVLTLQVKPVLAESLRAIDYLLPGILAMSIMQLGLFGTAQPLISLRTQGVLKRLGATPLRRSTLLMAYIALRLTIAAIQTALLVLIGVVAFDVSMAGSWLVFTGWVLLGTIMFIAIGFFIAAISKTEESGSAIVNLVNFPLLFLSGIFFPVNSLPGFLRPIIEAIPLTYMVDAMRQVMISSPPIHTQMLNLGVQVAWIAVMSLLAVRFFRWDTQ